MFSFYRDRFFLKKQKQGSTTKQHIYHNVTNQKMQISTAWCVVRQAKCYFKLLIGETQKPSVSSGEPRRDNKPF